MEVDEDVRIGIMKIAEIILLSRVRFPSSALEMDRDALNRVSMLHRTKCISCGQPNTDDCCASFVCMRHLAAMLVPMLVSIRVSVQFLGAPCSLAAAANIRDQFWVSYPFDNRHTRAGPSIANRGWQPKDMHHMLR